VKRGIHTHGAVVFFSLVGGLAAFGAIGLLVDPLAVAFFLALVRMYHRDFTHEGRRIPPVPGHSAMGKEPRLRYRVEDWWVEQLPVSRWQDRGGSIRL
jgi:hypothetical protein